MTQVILINKPFQVLCQFSQHEGKKTLKDFVPIEGVYPCGRLDFDSEGLLILTNNGSLQSVISQPSHKMSKTYIVQVEGKISDDAQAQLARGINLKDGMTRPAQCRAIEEPRWLWPREPPIRKRLQIPTSWLELTITEGKNRQVRRMTAAAGYPTLRLIRYQVGPWTLGDLRPGEWRHGQIPPAIFTQLEKGSQRRIDSEKVNAGSRPKKPRQSNASANGQRRSRRKI